MPTEEILDESLYYNENDLGSENEDDIVQDATSFNQAVIWGTDWTTESINRQLVKKNIDLFPKFQRRDAWSNKAKSKFIESLILGLPVPQIILAEKHNVKGKYIVIDGKQRLLTLRRFFSLDNDDGFEALRLTGLDILTQLNGKTYKNLMDNLEFNEELTQLENQSIRATIIKNWPNESFLYTVFLRLNTGSIKLSPQELRQALHPGPFIDFVDKFSTESQAIKIMLNLKKPDYRMRDVEIIIRYFSNKYFLSNYAGNLKKSFDETVLNLNRSWGDDQEKIIQDTQNLEDAILFTVEIFGGAKEAFSKWANDSFQNNFNRAIFDIMVYYFSIPEVISEIREHTKQNNVVDKFKELCKNDTEFLSSFEHTTKSMENTFKRLSTWGEALAHILDLKINVPYFVDGEYIEKEL